MHFDASVVTKCTSELKLNLSTKTRGNVYKLDTHRTKYDLRKYFFSNRIVNVWNTVKLLLNAGSRINAGSLINAGVLKAVC